MLLFCKSLLSLYLKRGAGAETAPFHGFLQRAGAETAPRILVATPQPWYELKFVNAFSLFGNNSVLSLTLSLIPSRYLCISLAPDPVMNYHPYSFERPKCNSQLIILLSNARLGGNFVAKNCPFLRIFWATLELNGKFRAWI